MTETEWLACAEPESMVEWVRQKASDRKVRLFATACCRRVWDRIPDKACRRAIELTELFTEGHATDQQFMAAHERAGAIYVALLNQSGMEAPETTAAYAAMSASAYPQPWLIGYDVKSAAILAAQAISRLTLRPNDEQAAQSALVRDIIGNPFRPATLDPEWLTSTVVQLARGIYDERAFDRLPILADALQDAGCENADILDHCRGPGPHVRGCWVVDLVLGKS